MAKPRAKRPSDPMQLAKQIGDIATGQTDNKPMLDPSKDDIRRVMSMLGKIGGPKGGQARAESLSKARRKAIARTAAQARWKKKKK
jgi:hypothetical protein